MYGASLVEMPFGKDNCVCGVRGRKLMRKQMPFAGGTECGNR